MKNRRPAIIISVLIVALLLSLGTALYSNPISRAQLLESPESSIAEAMSDYEPEAAAQDIKILAQCGNQKERAIVYEYKGRPMSAIAAGKLFGLRWDLLTAELCNSGIENGVQRYNPALPSYFLLRGWFHEQRYAYQNGQFTLAASVFAVHREVRLGLLQLLLFAVLFFVFLHNKRRNRFSPERNPQTPHGA